MVSTQPVRRNKRPRKKAEQISGTGGAKGEDAHAQAVAPIAAAYNIHKANKQNNKIGSQPTAGDHSKGGQAIKQTSVKKSQRRGRDR